MTQPQGSASNRDTTTIIYDGECPFCSEFARMTRLKESLGKVALVDARQGGALVDTVREAQYDLDQGMFLIYQGRFYHGAECVHMLALLSSDSKLSNRLFARLFRSPAFCRYSYPMLRAGRNLALKLMGRQPLANSYHNKK